MVTAQLPKKKSGVLSANSWAYESARSLRSAYERTRGARLSNGQIKGWIRTLTQTEDIVLKLEQPLRYREGARRHPATGQHFGALQTLKFLRDAREFLGELLQSGRPTDLLIEISVAGISREFKRKTGTPHHQEVALAVMAAFEDVVPKGVQDSDPAEWARKTIMRFEKRWANAPAMKRAFTDLQRSQINNRYMNPTKYLGSDPRIKGNSYETASEQTNILQDLARRYGGR